MLNFLVTYLEERHANKDLVLEELHISNLLLGDEGILNILNVMNAFTSIKKINIGATKITPAIGPIFTNFIRNFDRKRHFEIDFKIHDHRPVMKKIISEIKECVKEKGVDGEFKRRGFLKINL